ncbi:MAG: uroporphyrinogen decarboxylase family protein [Verrucomicrobiota bacterium]
MTSRELVYRTLCHDNPPRAPRQLWSLPIADLEHPGAARAIVREFPSDIAGIDGHLRTPARTRGDMHRMGEFTDAWGATFVNLQDGVIGEVKDPLVKDWATDSVRIHTPVEWLTIDRDAVNRDCGTTEKFCTGGCCPRPSEQLQFLRGSEDLYMDLLDPPPAMHAFLREMHAFYCDLLTRWAATDVDAINFMDDWGSQRALLISPSLWRAIFKPMYRDYAQIAHAAGKKIFMHSDGYILDIYPDLIEIGIDALNSQLFCMGVDRLAPFAGKITFWGEIDRQHLLPEGTPADIDRAVRQVHATLWRSGGCIAQCEFGAAAKPANVRQVFATWEELTSS